ncbi:MAG: phospholipase [Nostoc sp.]|uniref:alpha/beta hydrolase n=1 Tax=Nostoc sp. TaxID=1180 RepID=UPI002FF4F9E5
MESLRQVDSKAIEGRLLSRPTHPTTTALTGLHPLGLDGQRDGFIYVPEIYRADQPTPLVLVLHGAGGDAEGALKILYHLAIRFGTILLAVDSRQQTWDIIWGGYGPDIDIIDRALAQTFSHYAIAPNQVAIAGFSDGASYALSVGITNGDLFNHILAFSPGFMAPASQSGKPRIFISHGKFDTVLPIERCSRRIVQQLKQTGYDVEYREFNGLHTVPTVIAERAMEWFTQSAPDKVFHS